MEGCNKLTDKSLEILAQNSKNLIFLNLARVTELRDAVTTFGRNNTGLRMLSVFACSHVTDRAINQLMHHCPDLEDLNLGLTRVTDIALTSVRLSIVCSVCLCTDSLSLLVQIARSCPKLHTLQLYYSLTITDEGLVSVVKRYICKHCIFETDLIVVNPSFSSDVLS